ncbi:MAG: LamG-like jellyroll fold domain-containing protein, partial [Thermoanaerobaculia bacterium]
VALWVKGGTQADRRVFSEGSSTSQSPLFTIGTEWTGATGQVDVLIRASNGSAIVNHRLSRGIAFDGSWHHVAWVDQGGQAALYIDGGRDGTDFSYARGALSLNLTSIGAVLRATACCFFTGAIDEPAVWDRALSAEEVASLAAGGSPLEGLSYDRHLGLDLEAAMRGVNPGAYALFPFTLPDAGGVDSLVLRMRYDDGFLAYLNGAEAARRNAPAPAAWSSAATAERRAAEALAVEEINLTAHRGSLRSGANVLAIHGLNASAGDNDFLVLPELWAAAAAGEPLYFAAPSPGAANSGGAAAFVADLSFSRERGFHDAPFDLSISSPTPGAVIRYTTDFSEPTETRGQTYAGPIRIQRTTAVRARAFRPGFYPTAVATHTYLFLEEVIRQPKLPPGLPAVWQTGFTADYEMDPRICTDPSSPYFEPTIREDLKAIPTMSLVLDPDGLFGPANGIYNHSENRGLLWERSASAELIHPDGRKGFQVNCGLRMQGGASRDPVRQLKHSFRLLF